MSRPLEGRAPAMVRLLMVIALAGLFAVFVPESTAEPIVNVSPVQSKVSDQRDTCEGEGGRFYESTSSLGLSATTLCVGGGSNDVTCTYSVFTFECRAVRTNPLEGPNTALPDTAENVSDTAASSPPDMAADTQVAWAPTSTPGEATDPRIDLLIGMCRNLGGAETRSTSTSSKGEESRTDAFICQGGEFGALGCAVGDAGAWCALGLVQLPESDAIPPAATIALPSVTDLTVPAGIAEELGREEDIVVYNQQGSTVHDNALSQILVCRMLGGDAEVTVDRTTGGLNSVDVRCVGGVMGDWVCVNTAGFPPVCGARIQAPESPAIPPVPEQEQPADVAPTPTIHATATPTAPATVPSPTPTTEPTIPQVEPTEAPAEPTAQPTVVFPTFAGDPVIPPDKAEQPTQPTPTPVPIG